MAAKKKQNDKFQEEVKEQKKIQASLSQEAKAFKKQFAGKLLDLLTSGFGLVAALAWNELIKEVIDQYVKPYFGEGSGIISKMFYAVLVTVLAVLVTYNLSKLAEEKE